jgi:Zn-dependent oligopeptidase
MAKSSKAAYDLVFDISQNANPYAKAEAIELQKLADKLEHNITIEP